MSAKLQITDNEAVTKWGTLFTLDRLWATLHEKLGPANQISNSYPSDYLISRLSYSHFTELLKPETLLKRAVYEVQSIKNNWSVRELERSIATLLFKRTGLSTNKETVIAKMKDEPTAKNKLKRQIMHDKIL